MMVVLSVLKLLVKSYIAHNNDEIFVRCLDVSASEKIIIINYKNLVIRSLESLSIINFSLEKLSYVFSCC